jgi:hypothetical protein
MGQLNWQDVKIHMRTVIYKSSKTCCHLGSELVNETPGRTVPGSSKLKTFVMSNADVQEIFIIIVERLPTSHPPHINVNISW